MRIVLQTILLLLLHTLCSPVLKAIDLPPEPEREFRGGWVASVANIDWPSEKGLPVEKQKEELLAILDRAVQLRLNCIILQVRPACDALYASKYEPWSEYLTGEMGKPPEPFYDPLEFAVEEAHKRGLELHAWFNPYRARVLGSKTPAAPNHISKTHPELVRHYVKYLWLDPGEQGVQDHSIKVIMDVVKRYDVDGVHFDDYFYPYKDNDEAGHPLDFPDQQSWNRYKELGGKLEKNDWRRDNVNKFIHRLYQSIKAEKPWVKFGISPFGIWKPGEPDGIRGLNAYESLYADARKWLSEGWCDYFAPQLYWNIEQKEQSFPLLLKWWVEQNTKGRHLWPGISTARVGRTRGPEEIIHQIQLTRAQPGAHGNIHWNFTTLMQNRKGIADMLVKELYTEPALVPATPWEKSSPLPKPSLTGKLYKKDFRLKWRISHDDDVWQWVLQKRVEGKWITEILPADHRDYLVDCSEAGLIPDEIALRAVNRYGLLSDPALAQITQPR